MITAINRSGSINKYLLNGRYAKEEEHHYYPIEPPLPRNEDIIERSKKAFSDMKYIVFGVCAAYLWYKKRGRHSFRVKEELIKQNLVREGLTGKRII